MSKKDYQFGIAAGLLIGLLFMPVLKAAKPDLYDKLFLVIIPFFLLATPIGLRIAFFLGTKIKAVWQIGKFGVIGVLNTLVDLGVLTSLTFLFQMLFNTSAKQELFKSTFFILTTYSIYKAISFIVANVNSYFWNKYWTFEQAAKKKSSEEFVQFFVVSIVGFLINVFIASFVFKHYFQNIGLSENQLGLIGAAFGSVAGLAWNFIGYKLWVFKKQ